MASHPDLRAEQAYLDRAYDRLEAMRRAAEELRDSVIDAGRGGTHQARVERDVFVETSLQRLAQLNLGRAALCFGRIDREPDNGRDAPERFYIGRVAVSDEHQDPLVVDWRAPVAEAFYRATGRSPMGLRRRRHFGTDGRTLVGIEDEVFRSDGSGDGDLDLVGPGALLAALQRSRSGQMRDIVATVQREQDEIIRAELPGVLLVQGGPGTGKTAVALHRAAYLLYTYRFPLEHQGVLVVGPNQPFLRYIDQVLPSLGESGVALTTPAGLVPSIRPRGRDAPLAERVKGDGRMADVLARAVADRERGLRRDLAIGFGRFRLVLPAATTRNMVAAAKRRPGTHNARRRQVEGMVFRALHDQYLAATAREGPGGEWLDLSEFTAAVRHDHDVASALDRMWPRLAAEDLLNDLFGSSVLLNLATRGVLTDEERDSLGRPRAQALEEVAWTMGDVALVDDARALLGPLRPRRGEQDAGVRAYGHIVVDEAQDVPPMVLRMLTRRSISGSMTLVGDIGQATASAAPQSWDDLLAHLPGKRPARRASLTVNYRTPAEVMEMASEVLADAEVNGLVAPRSVRTVGRLPEFRPVVDETRLPADVAEMALAELAAVDGGTVAVIAAADRLAQLRPAMDAAALEWGEPERTGLSAPVTLLDVRAVKGLEFDSVVVVEPAEIAAEGGLRALFVALTRPTRRLVAVHAKPLPESMLRGLARARHALGEGPPAVAAVGSQPG